MLKAQVCGFTQPHLGWLRDISSSLGHMVQGGICCSPAARLASALVAGLRLGCFTGLPAITSSIRCRCMLA